MSQMGNFKYISLKIVEKYIFDIGIYLNMYYLLIAMHWVKQKVTEMCTADFVKKL